jgi:uncharacterized protein
MREIAQKDIAARIARDNPWWDRAKPDPVVEASYPHRVYFEPFKALALNYAIRRAAILLGPRRVGKTVMIKQIIAEAIASNVKPQNALYASIDTPLYSNISLESFLTYIPGALNGEQCLVVFDEIQYLKDWESHLKDLVDSYPNVKFVASGSAAAALRLKSRESGAGRFSDFMLPPLTFFEFLEFTGRSGLVIEPSPREYEAVDINQLNASFIDYLNFGGYPEAVLNDEIRKDPDQFIRNDIIDKVLLKDLPSLYGIQDIQGLNKLFMYLAYNTGQEASLENISNNAGMAKPTIKKYIEYLESAFLIIKVTTVDDTCRTMQRERQFKVYLNNPSMRAALFAPVTADDTTTIGHLAESAVFSQWQHSPASKDLRYARWRNEGEVDVAYLSQGTQRPRWIGEIKWSDRIAKSVYSDETKSMRHLLSKHPTIKNSFFTSKSFTYNGTLCGTPFSVRPTALYCYLVGKNITTSLSALNEHPGTMEVESDESE